MGLCYYYGRGVVEDEAKAREWFEKSAEQGYSYAQYELGRCYQRGRGGGVNISKAREWYQKAAEQGHQAAQIELDAL